MARWIAALAAAGSVATLLRFGRESGARRRLRALVPPRRLEPRVVDRVAALVARVGGVARRLAGRRPDADADRRVGGALVLAAVGTLVHPAVGLAGAVAPSAVRVLARRRAARRADDRLLDDLPDVVDLFGVAAGGGLTVHHAVGAVARVVDGPVGTTLGEVQRRVSMGVRLADALTLLGHLGAPARPLMAALVSAERDGAPLAGPLERVADDARDRRRRRAEERARRVPVRLLFPLVLCVLPAFALVTVVPLLAGTLQTLSP
jgi:tight adherence protein C